MPDSSLEPVRVSLAYRLGEITLFERGLEGLADRRHFTNQETLQTVPSIPVGADPSDFYFFPCYPVAAPPPVFARRDGWLWYTPYSFKNYFIDLRKMGSFENYLATFSGKSRSTLKRKVKKFAEASRGDIEWRSMETPERMDDFLKFALPLSARTYQERLMGAGLPQSAEFAHRLRQSAADGKALAYLLFLGGAGSLCALLLPRRHRIVRLRGLRSRSAESVTGNRSAIFAAGIDVRRRTSRDL